MVSSPFYARVMRAFFLKEGLRLPITKPQEYNESAIRVLDGLEAIRLRPGMYIGGTDREALHHLVWEIVANSLDEFLAGYGSEIIVTLHKDGRVSVEDFGRGIPLGIHPQTGKSTLETILTVPHAGGKFGGSGYRISGGLHGVGATCVNALSVHLKARVRRDGREVVQAYSRGVLQKEEERKFQGQSGTLIEFLPDPEIFEDTRFDKDVIKNRLRQFAFLTAGLKLVFADEEGGHQEVFQYPGGLLEYMKHLGRGKPALHKPWMIQAEHAGIQVEACLQYTDTYSTQILSFVNLIPTREGGTHEAALKTALTRTLNDMANEKRWIRENLAGDEWMEGLTCILHIKMPEPQFEGQTKNKLASSEARSAVLAVLSQQLPGLFSKDPAVVKKIAEKALLAKRAKEAARKAKELVRNPRKKDYSHLVSGKYAPCSGKKPEENELFIVEGDSAGGSAKQGRDRMFQSVLPLRGKPLNVEKTRLDKALDNEEIRSIIAALGAGVGEDFEPDRMTHHKVIIMTDADVDGAHIRTLLLTFFYRYMPQVIELGRLYIAQPPLYKVAQGAKAAYAFSEQEKNSLLKSLKGAQVQRFKGLGEMNPEQLWETTMNPATRTLLKVEIGDAAEAERLLATLMGDDPETRKEFLASL